MQTSKADLSGEDLQKLSDIETTHLLLPRLWVKQTETAAAKNKGGEKGVRRLLKG